MHATLFARAGQGGSHGNRQEREGEDTLGEGVPDAVFQFLLFSGIPAGHFLEIAGHPADLDDVVAPALGADRGAAEGAVLDAGDDLVETVAMVQGTHDLEVRIAADGTGRLVNDEVAGMALVTPLGGGNIFEPPE
jgi:hypothetical protein